MVSVTLEQLYGWMAQFLWPFVRMLALMGSAPVFGESSVPARAKVGLAAVLTVAVAPAVGPLPDVSPGSLDGLWIVAQQVLIGVAMGLAMRMAFAAAQSAGELVGLQMGLSFASFFDPATGANTAVLARLMNILAVLVFLAVDGHLLMLAALVHSFQALPISAEPLAVGGWGVLVEWASQVLAAGLMLALPLITVLLTINLSMAILNRTAPQLSVFAVGFPISLTVGLVLLAIVLPQTTPYLERLFEQSFQVLDRLLNSLAGG
ncbi:flagellar biosynthetic protein FliR [Orrella sp. JC864]|uniref:flagellar biosynthetic protein FliR n=1 Tax=Orrella sp. JC864 TaxID=3120298 RepID=UPI00300A350B